MNNSQLKYEKYIKKIQLMNGGIIINGFISNKNTRIIETTNNIFYEINIISKGANGSVYLYVDKQGKNYAVKKYKYNESYIKEFDNYNYLTFKNSDIYFVKSTFVKLNEKTKETNHNDDVFSTNLTILNSDDINVECILIMEKMNQIDVVFIKENYVNFKNFLKNIFSSLYELAKVGIFYTDLKLPNIVEQNIDKNEKSYKFVDFGGMCHEPNFQCETSYYNLTSDMESIGETIIDFEEIKNSYFALVSSKKSSPISPESSFSFQETETYYSKMQHYLIFLFWLLIVQIYDAKKVAPFHPFEMIKAYGKKFTEYKEKISLIKKEIVTFVENLIINNDATNMKDMQFFNDLINGNVKSLRQIYDFFYVE